MRKPWVRPAGTCYMRINRGGVKRCPLANTQPCAMTDAHFAHVSESHVDAEDGNESVAVICWSALLVIAPWPTDISNSTFLGRQGSLP